MAVQWTGAGLRPRTAHARRALQVAIDATAWGTALVACAVLRVGPEDVHATRLLALFPVVVLAQFVAGYMLGLYRGRSIFGSFEEVATLARVVLVSGSVVFVLDALLFMQNRPIPLSSVVAGAAIAFLIMGGTRYWWRMMYDRSLRPSLTGTSRVIVFGVGDGGQRAIRAMLRDPKSAYVPVVALDDDRRLQGLRIMGVPVVGDRQAMAEVARRYQAPIILLALPAASGRVIRELTDQAQACGLKVRVLPAVQELLDGDVSVGDIRIPEPRDLLGRHHIETDLEAVADHIAGRRVVVTGAGGSIGSELCRQLAALQPAELIMIDRDESALHAVQLSIDGHALLNTPSTVLLDIRDRAGVISLFLERRPEVVFHAAALKHLPLLESYPIEALKTNVWGTLAVLEAAATANVERFVNVSTDKAANPCNTLGFSKRVAEGLTAWTNERAFGRYLSVRFGNVLGSRGSVLTTFQRQLEAGGPLTVTDPAVSRFFMTVEEAVQLVLQAAAIGEGGDVLVLDMGEPVRIADVAEQLARSVDPPCAIKYVGLRPGEKLSEQLFGDGENARPSAHPLIRSVSAPPVDGDAVRNVDPQCGPDYVADVLMELCVSMSLEPYGEVDLTRAELDVDDDGAMLDDVSSMTGGD
jgi:FlaA1/EpsC-like NDP-sugar epimerase